MSRFRVLLIAAVMVTTFVHAIAFAEPAAASCAPPLTVTDAITQSDLVVVGTVTSARSRNRIATVAVDEVWKGNAGSTVEVVGGPQSDNAGSSVDRTYEVGVRYLIVAYEPGAHGYPSVFGGRYEDNNCSVTQPWTDTLAVFRPATAKVIAPPSTSTGTSTGPAVLEQSTGSIAAWIVAACVVMVVMGLSALWWRRRRRPAALQAG